VSAVIIAKNEAERIEDCLASVAWADEIIVVDSGSTDATCDIARRHTDRIHAIPWRGFGPQKQAAVDLASHDWVLARRSGTAAGIPIERCAFSIAARRVFPTAWSTSMW
jgi:cellulose synthase/poly-beta-1,6-N-acetylglucosamine synthase-like glycosyltransferase